MKPRDQAVLTQYLKSRKWALCASEALLSIAILLTPFLLFHMAPEAFTIENKIGLVIASLLLAYLFGYLLCGRYLMQIYKNVKKIRDGKYEVVSDAVTSKFIQNGPFLSGKMYMIGFEKYYPAPARKNVPHKNCVPVCKKTYEKLSVEDTVWYLVVSGNHGYMACFLNPEPLWLAS